MARACAACLRPVAVVGGRLAFVGLSARGGRHPPRVRTPSVAASRRLRCDAQTRAAPGQLASLTSFVLAQTLPGGLDVEARCARSARVLRFSPTPTHPWRVPPAAPSTIRAARPVETPPLLAQSWPGVAGDARRRRRAAQGLRPARATRAHQPLTRRALNAVSAANEVNCTPGRKTEQRSGVGPQG